MENSLIHYLEQIPDCRERGGLRHPLPLVLLIVIMAIMSGEYGYRGMERFIDLLNCDAFDRQSLQVSAVG